MYSHQWAPGCSQGATGRFNKRPLMCHLLVWVILGEISAKKSILNQTMFWEVLGDCPGRLLGCLAPFWRGHFGSSTNRPITCLQRGYIVCGFSMFRLHSAPNTCFNNLSHKNMYAQVPICILLTHSMLVLWPLRLCYGCISLPMTDSAMFRLPAPAP
jgi:hypothetical protein